MLCNLATVSINTYFVSTWLEVLFTFWSDAFLSALQQFNSQLEGTHEGPTRNLEIFDKAAIVHPWLSSSDLCQMCELGLEAMDEDRLPELASKIREFATEWHACVDRGWPCDTGEAFAASRPGILSWYLWLAGGSTEKTHLDLGVAYCRKALAALAVRSPEDGQIDTKLDSIVLGALLRDVRKLVPSDKYTDSYRHAKEHITRLVVATFAGTPYTAKTIEAIIWVLSEYAYNVLGVDRRFHIASHMRHAARGEPSLHMMKEFYRDHFFHTIEVCFLETVARLQSMVTLFDGVVDGE
jgi:hypothetical protein